MEKQIPICLSATKKTGFPWTIDPNVPCSTFHGRDLIACLALMLGVSLSPTPVAAAQLREQHQILLSVNSLSPAGLYGSTGIDSSGLDYVYPHYGLANVFAASLPVAAPGRLRTVFARFETGPAGSKLVFRRLTDGRTNRVIAIEGYNPQWFPDGQRLFYETPASAGAAFWSIEAESGLPQKLFDVRSQYYPPAEPSGAAVLSANGTEAIYHKFISSPRTLLTPVIVDLNTKTERPLLVDSPCTLNGTLVPSATLVSSPAPPLTVRHMHWSPTGRKVVLFASFQLPGAVGRLGILVADLETSPIALTMIQETTNPSVDHLENYFISPEGSKVVFNRTVASHETVFISSVGKADALPLGEGHIIAGAPNKEAWPLSPWSHDGTRLLTQTNDDGSLWVMNRNGSGRSRLTPEGVPGSFKIPDVQWVDFDSQPTDVRITDIRPIQVIEGAPLVLDKATMVRVFVKLTGSSQVDDVMMKLDFDGQTYTLTNTVVTHEGVTYVLPPEYVNSFERDKNDPNQLRAYYVRRGLTSFNFLSKFLKPRTTGAMTVSATLDPQKTLSDFEDINKDNNFLSRTVPVKAVNGQTQPNVRPKFTIQFQPALTIGGIPSHKSTTDELKAKAKVWSDFVLAIFPVPEVNTRFITSTKTILKPGGFAPVLVKLPLGLITGQGALNRFFFNIDRTVYILPEGEVSVIPFVDWKGVADPIMGYGALLDETAENFALAHELSHTLGVGHDSDDDHPRGQVGEDGWDVSNLISGSRTTGGAKIGLEPGNPLSNLNYYSIMRAEDAPYDTWVTRRHYDLMLDELVQGGKDPPLLLVRGVVFRDGSAILLPMYTAEGVLETPRPGIYSVETLDAMGGLLDRTSFDAPWTEPDQNIEASFAVAVPFDARTAAIRLSNGNTVLKQINRSTNPPVVDVQAVEDLGAGKFRVHWSASDADGDGLSHSLAYSHDGESWEALDYDFQGTTFDADLSKSPGGTAARVKVVTTDGVNTVVTFSPVFAVPTKAPSVAILTAAQVPTPAAPARFFLAGFGYDPEDGLLPESSLTWASDRDGPLGQGERIDAALSPGLHAITLVAVDGDGNSARSTIQVEALVPPGSPARLGEARWLSDGKFDFALLDGEPGQRYGVQRSTNLVEWIEWSTVTRNQSVVRITDRAPTNSPYAFYRLVVP